MENKKIKKPTIEENILFLLELLNEEEEERLYRKRKVEKVMSEYTQKTHEEKQKS